MNQHLTSETTHHTPKPSARTRRRPRYTLVAGALALAGAISAAGVARAWIAAVQPAAILFTPPSVVPGNPSAPDIWAFNEKQDVILPVPILLDVQPVNPGVKLPADLNPVWIPAGTCVSSHYVHYEDTVLSTVTGGVRYVRPILGVAVRQPTLDATNFLGRAGVAYPTAANCNAVAGVDCGMELLPQDELRVDANRVQVRFEAQTPGDRIRVVTAGDPAHCHPLGQGNENQDD
jgi:hypothetical protein